MDVDSARDHMGPGGDLDMNGAHPPDDRAVSAGDGADYPAPGSVAGNGVDSAGGPPRSDGGGQRGEKIIKVLNRSLLCVQFV